MKLRLAILVVVAGYIIWYNKAHIQEFVERGAERYKDNLRIYNFENTHFENEDN